MRRAQHPSLTLSGMGAKRQTQVNRKALALAGRALAPDRQGAGAGPSALGDVRVLLSLLGYYVCHGELDASRTTPHFHENLDLQHFPHVHARLHPRVEVIGNGYYAALAS